MQLCSDVEPIQSCPHLSMAMSIASSTRAQSSGSISFVDGPQGVVEVNHDQSSLRAGRSMRSGHDSRLENVQIELWFGHGEEMTSG